MTNRLETILALAFLAMFFTAPVSAQMDDAASLPTGRCETVRFEGTRYTVCGFDPTIHDIRLFHRDGNGVGFRDFSALETFLDGEGLQLNFAMNAGMYHADRDAVGLYVEQGIERNPVNQNEGPGNFHLLPNGIFYLEGSAAGILETQAYLTSGINPDFATQSGPMLIIDGRLHPRFLPDGTSRKIRNGVGIAADGRTIVFALSEERVNFHDFARLFRDKYGAKNALYLDGSISRLHVRDLERSDPGRAMGPIVGVVARKPAPQLLNLYNQQRIEKASVFALCVFAHRRFQLGRQ